MTKKDRAATTLTANAHAILRGGLTRREMEVLRSVVTGYSNKEIAARLGITQATVRHHLTNIFRKLGVRGRLELILFALHHDLVKH